MKRNYTLTEAEIKDAIAAHVKRLAGYTDDDIRKFDVSLNYYNAGNDPRETSYYSATVSEK